MSFADCARDWLQHAEDGESDGFSIGNVPEELEDVFDELDISPRNSAGCGLFANVLRAIDRNGLTPEGALKTSSTQPANRSEFVEKYIRRVTTRQPGLIEGFEAILPGASLVEVAMQLLSLKHQIVQEKLARYYQRHEGEAQSSLPELVWDDRARPVNAFPGVAYSILLAFGSAPDDRDDIGTGRIVEVLQVEKSEGNGLSAGSNDDEIRHFISRFEQNHAQFLINKGLLQIADTDKEGGLQLTEHGKQIVEYNKTGHQGRARRLFLEALENTCYPRSHFGSTETGEAIRPLAYLGQAFQASNLETLSVKHIQTILSAPTPKAAAEQLNKLNEQNSRTKQNNERDKSPVNVSAARGLLREAAYHPAFQWGNREQQALTVRNENLLDHLTKQPWKGPGPSVACDDIRTVTRAPGLRPVDMKTIGGIGEKTEATLYEKLAGHAQEELFKPTDSRSEQLVEAVIDEAVPSNVDTESVRSALLQQDRDDELLYRGELQAKRQAVRNELEPEKLPVQTARQYLEQALPGLEDGPLPGPDCLLARGDHDDPSSYREGISALFGFGDVEKQLAEARTNRGESGRLIRHYLEQCRAYYYGTKRAYRPQVKKSSLNKPRPRQGRALDVERAVKLSLASLAGGDEAFERKENLRTADSLRSGREDFTDQPDITVTVNSSKQFTIEVAAPTKTKHRSFEAEKALERAEAYCEREDIEPDDFPVLFLTMRDLASDDDAMDKLTLANNSSITRLNTMPAPIDIAGFIDLMQGIQDNGSSIEELYGLLYELGRTLAMHVKYDHPVDHWVEAVYEPMIEHMREHGQLDATSKKDMAVELPVGREGSHETQYCSIKVKDLPDTTYEQVLERYDDELTVGIEAYRDDDKSAKKILQDIMFDASEQQSIRQEFCGTTLTPAGFRYLLRGHRQNVEKATQKAATTEGGENKAPYHEKKKQQLKKARKMIRNLLSTCPDSYENDPLKKSDGINFKVELQFWQERISRIIEGEIEVSEVEQEALSALAEKEQFAEWVAGFETTKQKCAALHGLFVEPDHISLIKEDVEKTEFGRLDGFLKREYIRSYRDIQKTLSLSDRNKHKK